MINQCFTSKKLLTLLVALPMFALLSCGSGEDTDETDTDSVVVTEGNDAQGGGQAVADINGTHSDTTVTGTVMFTENGGKVKMMLNITVPKKAGQSVAVHIHEHGDCGDMGKDAHGHWNPTNQKHGKWGEGSFHLGDIGNVNLNGEGQGTMEMETDLWTIGGTDTTRNILSKAIIVHSGVDDYTSQPSGDAGNRIGCGIIK